MTEAAEVKQSAKERILHAAIDIMREKGEVEYVTIRSIAGRAGVGLGLINYHFHSKEKLVGEAVRFFQTREIISGWEGQLLFRPKNPVVLVGDMLKSFADFMADFPRISRISIFRDLSSSSEDDNTMETVKGLTPYIQEALGRNGKDGRAFRIAWTIISTVQTAFIRSELFSRDGGYDFFNKDERDSFIGELVTRCVR